MSKLILGFEEVSFVHTVLEEFRNTKAYDGKFMYEDRLEFIDNVISKFKNEIDRTINLAGAMDLLLGIKSERSTL